MVEVDRICRYSPGCQLGTFSNIIGGSWCRVRRVHPWLEEPMHRLVLSLALLLSTLLALQAPPAQAQNARSWVASNGLNGNPCTRASPCATFAHALTQTNAGGEINCVDQGDFGDGSTLAIQMSLTIDCDSVHGRLGNGPSGSNAVYVQASPTDVIVLRGLDIYGNGKVAIGIGFVGGAALHVENCVIHDFSSASLGWGIVDEPAFDAVSELFVSDTVVMNNGTASSGGGISVTPFVANSITRVTLDRVEARNNFFGIKADSVTGGISGGVVNMTVRDSVSSGNRSNGIVGTGNASGPSIIMTIKHSASSQNATAGFGVISDGPKTTITLSNSTVMGNINGIGASNGGKLVSYSNNKVSLNSTDGSPTSVIAAK
jgi:hypothetical protein